MHIKKVVKLLLLASFCYRLWQLLPSLLYVLMYKMCHKLHNLMCFYPI